MPKFASCDTLNLSAEEKVDCPEAKLFFYIQKELKLEKQKDHAGTLEIAFTVDETGAVLDPEIIRSIDEETDQAILNVFRNMPTWIPGSSEGIPEAQRLVQRIQVPIGENTIMEQYLEMPRYPGCEDISDEADHKSCWEQLMLQFIYTNIQYPEFARENGIEGTVVIRFVVDKDGSVIDTEILREIGGTCGAESLRVVNMMPNWIPGKLFNEPAKIQYYLPVKFKLEGQTKKERKKKRN